MQCEQILPWLTTEVQTLELLLSPGLGEKLQLNRDVDLFDLGREVNERLRDRTGGRGRQFMSDILSRQTQAVGDLRTFVAGAVKGEHVSPAIRQRGGNLVSPRAHRGRSYRAGNRCRSWGTWSKNQSPSPLQGEKGESGPPLFIAAAEIAHCRLRHTSESRSSTRLHATGATTRF